MNIKVQKQFYCEVISNFILHFMAVLPLCSGEETFTGLEE